MDISGVPQSIDKPTLRKVLAELGFKLDNLVEITFGAYAIMVKVYSEDPDGNRYMDFTGEEAATHVLQVPYDKE